MTSHVAPPVLLSGTSHPGFASEVAKFLGIELGKVSITRFPDGEAAVQVQESVRGQDVFILQHTGIEPDKYFMELLVLIDALKRASARSIIPVIPYFGYCRQDRKDKPRVPITAKLVANLLVNAGASRLLTMDLHADQIQGFFDIPVDCLHGRSYLADAVKEIGLLSPVVVAPDLGSIKIAHAMASHFGGEIAVIEKRRIDASTVAMTGVIGDIEGKDVLLADDMCSTAGTLALAAKACHEKGARRVVAAVTHGLFVGEAIARLMDSPVEQVLFTNTLPIPAALVGHAKFRQISVGSLFAQAIQCILSAKSISSLFDVASSNRQ